MSCKCPELQISNCAQQGFRSFAILVGVCIEFGPTFLQFKFF